MYLKIFHTKFLLLRKPHISSVLLPNALSLRQHRSQSGILWKKRKRKSCMYMYICVCVYVYMYVCTYISYRLINEIFSSPQKLWTCICNIVFKFTKKPIHSSHCIFIFFASTFTQIIIFVVCLSLYCCYTYT